MALVVAVTAGAQNNPQGWSNYDLPFNPDANNDNAIGSEDLLQVLAVFGNEYGNNPPECDYEGTDLENLWANLVTGVAVMDSLFYEVEVFDAELTTYPGCPDMVWDTLNVVFNGVIYDWNLILNSQYWKLRAESDPENFMEFEWNATGSNSYLFRWAADDVITPYITLGWMEDANFTVFTPNIYLPFPDGYYLDENGINFPPDSWNSPWNSPQPHPWLDWATSITIIPYWHYAE